MSKLKRTPDEFEHESLQDTESIVTYLEALASGLRSGRLLFCWGDSELILKPNGLLQFAVKARKKDDRMKVSIKISWKDPSTQEAPAERLIIRGADE